MRGFVAPTDHGWYQFLLGRPEVSEVNFWRPGGGSFAALKRGEPLFFKLEAPYNAIGGFGLFARFARLPVWRAWDVFGEANGTSDEHVLLQRLQRLSGQSRVADGLNRVIGCIGVTDAVFFAADEWLRLPRRSCRAARMTSRAVRVGGCGALPGARGRPPRRRGLGDRRARARADGSAGRHPSAARKGQLPLGLA